MPTGLTTDQLRELARRGAEVRMRELREEKTQIEAMLGAGDHRAAASEPRQAGLPRRRRRRMSAAQRKAVGERMRKYWAARRKAEGRK